MLALLGSRKTSLSIYFDAISEFPIIFLKKFVLNFYFCKLLFRMNHSDIPTSVRNLQTPPSTILGSPSVDLLTSKTDAVTPPHSPPPSPTHVTSPQTPSTSPSPNLPPSSTSSSSESSSILKAIKTTTEAISSTVRRVVDDNVSKRSRLPSEWGRDSSPPPPEISDVSSASHSQSKTPLSSTSNPPPFPSTRLQQQQQQQVPAMPLKLTPTTPNALGLTAESSDPMRPMVTAMHLSRKDAKGTKENKDSKEAKDAKEHESVNLENISLDSSRKQWKSKHSLRYVIKLFVVFHRIKCPFDYPSYQITFGQCSKCSVH
jgi:hypothetical protein